MQTQESQQTIDVLVSHEELILLNRPESMLYELYKAAPTADACQWQWNIDRFPKLSATPAQAKHIVLKGTPKIPAEQELQAQLYKSLQRTSQLNLKQLINAKLEGVEP